VRDMSRKARVPLQENQVPLQETQLNGPLKLQGVKPLLRKLLQKNNLGLIGLWAINKYTTITLISI
jgi:hypothetical protein